MTGCRFEESSVMAAFVCYAACTCQVRGCMAQTQYSSTAVGVGLSAGYQCVNGHSVYCAGRRAGEVRGRVGVGVGGGGAASKACGRNMLLQ
jgi:hypothetical protein